jgi:hypothetical protein
MTAITGSLDTHHPFLPGVAAYGCEAIALLHGKQCLQIIQGCYAGLLRLLGLIASAMMEQLD